MEDSIDDTDRPREDVSFYRQFDPDNVEHCYKFSNQIRDPNQAVYEDDEPCFGEGTQPEVYVPENRDNVEFDKF